MTTKDFVVGACNASNISLHMHFVPFDKSNTLPCILFVFTDKCEVYYEQSYQCEKHSGHYHVLKITAYQTHNC